MTHSNTYRETRRYTQGRVTGLAWEDDDTLLVASLGGLYRCDRQGLRARPIADGVELLALSADRRRAAVLVPHPRVVRVLSLPDAAPLWEVGAPIRDFVGCLALSPDGEVVAWGEGRSTLRLVEVATGAPRATLTVEESFVGCQGARWTAAGELVTWNGDGVVEVWSAAGERLKRWKHHRWVRDLQVLAGDRLALAANPDSATVSDADCHLWIRGLDGALIAAIDTPEGASWSRDQRALAVTPDGARLASVGEDERLHLVSTADWTRERSVSLEVDGAGKGFHGYAAAASPDGRHLAVLTGSDANVGDGDYRASLQLFSVAGERLAVDLGYLGVAHAVSLGGGATAVAHEWGVDLHRGDHQERLTTLNAAVLALAPDGARAVVGQVGFEGVAQLLDVASGATLEAPKINKQALHRAAFSPDGEHYAIAGDHAWIFKVGRKSPVRCIKGLDRAWGVAFSRDGKKFAHTAPDGQVWIALRPRFATLKQLTLPSVAGARGAVDNHTWDVAFAPDGARVVVACNDAAWIVAVADGSIVRGLPQPEGVRSVAWSRDGRLIADGSPLGEVRIWEAETGAVLARFRHGGAVLNLVFGEDGSLTSAGEDGAARVFSPM